MVNYARQTPRPSQSSAGPVRVLAVCGAAHQVQVRSTEKGGTNPREDIELSSGFFRLLGPYANLRFSTSRRVASSSAAVASSEAGENAEADPGLTSEQPLDGQVRGEEQCTTSLSEPGADLSECADVDMDRAHEVDVSQPPPLELPRNDIDDSSVVDSRDLLYLSGIQDSAMYGSGSIPDSLVDGMIDDSSGSDVPLAVVASRLRSPRKHTLTAEEPSSNRKGKSKVRADPFVSVDVDASSEGVTLGESYRWTGGGGLCTMSDLCIQLVDDNDTLPSPSRVVLATTAPGPSPGQSQSHSARGRDAKAKAPLRNLGANESTRALKVTPRRASGAMCSDTSGDEASDDDLVAVQGSPRSPGQYLFIHVVSHDVRLTPYGPVRPRPRTKSIWRVVEPPRSSAYPAKRSPAPSSRPRVWAGVR
jgi:hypothetical protein